MGTLNNRCRITIGTQKGTRILTSTQVSASGHLSGSRTAPCVAYPLALERRQVEASDAGRVSACQGIGWRVYAQVFAGLGIKP